MWPSKRVQNSPVWRYTDPNADAGDGRARVVRKRETRRLVAPRRPAGHDRRVTR
jgi:hypothetical protein